MYEFCQHENNTGAAELPSRQLEVTPQIIAAIEAAKVWRIDLIVFR